MKAIALKPSEEAMHHILFILNEHSLNIELPAPHLF
jgi:hypothetical protein